MLATAKAAGPRHGDRLSAPRRKADSVVDETDAPIGLPRYLAVQTKLTVGSRDDPLEREADALAHAVRHNEPARDPSRLSSSSTTTTPLPRRASADVPAQASTGGATHSDLLPAEGASPLSSSVRSRVEPILDADSQQRSSTHRAGIRPGRRAAPGASLHPRQPHLAGSARQPGRRRAAGARGDPRRPAARRAQRVGAAQSRGIRPPRGRRGRAVEHGRGGR